MSKILIAIAVVIMIIIVAIVLKQLLEGKSLKNKEERETLLEESQRGVRAIAHNNASPTVEECFVGAEKVLKKYNLENSMESVIKSSGSRIER